MKKLSYIRNVMLFLLIILTFAACQQDFNQSLFFHQGDIQSRFADFSKISSYTIILLCILGVLTLLFSWIFISKADEHDLFDDFWGKVSKNGMKRLWMFNKEPYIKATTCTLLVCLAFLIALVIIMAVGCIYYGLLFLFKLIVTNIMVIGVVLILIGVILFFRGILMSAVLIFVAGAILLFFQDEIYAWGSSCADGGFNLWDQTNLFEWGLGLFSYFYDLILAFLFAPAMLFASVALLIILVAFLMMTLEYLMMRVYCIRRPCPVCGSTRTPEYYANPQHKHPVPLHPGIYGVFTHTNPDTGKELPTTLFNGKGRLLRKCKSCHHFMIDDTGWTFGEEKHVIIIGHKTSGKTYLLYTALHELKDNYFGSSRAWQRESTDITNIDDNWKRIEAGNDMPTDDTDEYTAVQLMVERNNINPIPYHLFFYDVAGEKFNPNSKSYKTALDFFQNMQTVIFVIDPTMIKYTYNRPSEVMQSWLNRHHETECYSLDDILSILHNILNDTGRKPEDINFYFVCVKADKGYLEACGVKLESNVDSAIKTFMEDHLVLGNLIQTVENEFKAVHFDYSSVRPEYRDHLRSMFIDILEELGVYNMTTLECILNHVLKTSRLTKELVKRIQDRYA